MNIRRKPLAIVRLPPQDNAYQRARGEAEHKRRMDKELIQAMLSPGSIDAEYRANPLPTGQFFKVVCEKRTRTETIYADAKGQIILLNLPCIESPWIHVTVNSEGDITSAKGLSIPSYEEVSDPLYDKRIYGYRMVGNSVTSYNSSAPLTMQGSVSCATVPLSEDDKQIPIAGSSTQFSYVRTLDRIPLKATSISNMASSYFTAPASGGAYVALRHTDPTMPFMLRNSDSAKAEWKQRTLDLSTLEVSATGSTVRNLLALSDDKNIAAVVMNENPELGPIACSGLSKMNLGVTIYDGLTPGTPMTFKFAIMWEIIPKMGSDKIGDARRVPPFDPQFMRAMSQAQDKAQSVGNAASNSLGSFLKGLGSVWNSLAPVAEIAADLLPPKYGIAVKGVLKAGDAIQQIARPTPPAGVVTKQAVDQIVSNKVNKALASQASVAPQLLFPNNTPYYNGQTGTTTRPRRRQ